MGVVYRARQISIDRIIALKMLNSQMAADPTWVQRFYNEAKACSRLQHPNTIRMFDFGQTSDGKLFMTMEFLDGQSLRDAVAKGPLAPQRVVKILIQCCASLAEAHSIGIIHSRHQARQRVPPEHGGLARLREAPRLLRRQAARGRSHEDAGRRRVRQRRSTCPPSKAVVCRSTRDRISTRSASSRTRCSSGTSRSTTRTR